MHVDHTLRAKILGEYQQLAQRESLPDRIAIREYSNRFRQRFGPEMLSSVHGVALLELMYGNDHKRDTLAYWLEFKNDKELPDYFGGIKGINPLKFGIAWRPEDGGWVTGGPSSRRPLSVSEAIELVSQQRDELIAGAHLIDSLPHLASTDDYRTLELDMQRLAPTVSLTMWGHKYFTLIQPDRLDNYHNTDWQCFHLVKLRQQIPSELGRYQAAGFFAALSRNLEIPLLNLTYVLNQLHGRPHRFWAVRWPGQSVWDEWVRHSLVSLNLPDERDLSGFANRRELRTYVQSMIDRFGHSRSETTGVLDFVDTMRDGDLVIVTEDHTVRGVGRISGTYMHVPSSELPHRRIVEWIMVEPWTGGLGTVRLPAVTPLRFEIRSHTRLMIQAERHVAQVSQQVQVDPPQVEAVEISSAGKLRQFRLTFKPSPSGYFHNLNISVLVGKNGTGKTTLLRVLSKALCLAEQTPHLITYRIRGERMQVTGVAKEYTLSPLLPEKVIVSTYAAIDQYPYNLRQRTDQYVHVGPRSGFRNRQYMDILPVLLRPDRALLTRQKEQQLTAYEKLLKMLGCDRPFAVEIGEPQVRQGNDYCSILDLTDVEINEHMQQRFRHYAAHSHRRDAFSRLLGLLRSSPEASEKGGRMISIAQGVDYPGGDTAFLADLRALRSEIDLRDIWFDRDGARVALSQLSSGERSMLHRFSSLLYTIEDDSVVLIDEPETHLHPEWILRYIDILTECFGSYRAHIIIATHSPLIAADLPSECIIRLDEYEGRIVATNLEEETFGATPLQILNDVFGVPDYIGAFTQKRVEEIRTVIRQGDFAAAEAMLEKLGSSALKFELYRTLERRQRAQREQD